MKASASLAGRKYGSVTRVLTAGMTVAALDAGFAILVYVVVLDVATPVRVFQAIARGLLGNAAFAGGLATAGLGLALHVTIAHTWAAVYLVAYRLSSRLRHIARTGWGAVRVGLVFGVLVWLAMNFVVKPAAGLAPTPATSALFAVMLAGHAVVVGLPIALIVRPEHDPVTSLADSSTTVY